MPNASEGRTWETADEEEDWLTINGAMLAYITQDLANRLRDEFPSLPAQVVLPVYGYVTPVAAEYVRRAIWCETTLSFYQKAQLHGNTVDMYGYLISRYKDLIRRNKGHLPSAEQCIDELLAGPILMSDASFVARMSRVTPIFDKYFPENRGKNIDDDQIFAGAFVGMVLGIVKEGSGVLVPLTDQDLERILEDFEWTGRKIRQILGA